MSLYSVKKLKGQTSVIDVCPSYLIYCSFLFLVSSCHLKLFLVFSVTENSQQIDEKVDEVEI